MKRVIATFLLAISTIAQAVTIDGVELGKVVSTMTHSDGRISVVAAEPCVLREIVVAGGAKISVLKEGKVIAQGCVVGINGKAYAVFEGANFELTKYELDVSKFVRYEQKTLSYL